MYYLKMLAINVYKTDNEYILIVTQLIKIFFNLSLYNKLINSKLSTE